MSLCQDEYDIVIKRLAEIIGMELKTSDKYIYRLDSFASDTQDYNDKSDNYYEGLIRTEEDLMT